MLECLKIPTFGKALLELFFFVKIAKIHSCLRINLFMQNWKLFQTTPFHGNKTGTRIEKNTTILSNRSKILQKRNKHSDYHIMIKYLLHYNNFIVNGPCHEKKYI
jgi:hypothetical protein